MAFNNGPELREMKALLLETSNSLSKFGYDINNRWQEVFATKEAFQFYVESLAEGLDAYPDIKEEFMDLAWKVRAPLLENSMFGFYPQAKLALPIFRKFWPKLVARQAVTVLPMDASEVVRVFLTATARVWGGTTYELPSNTSVTSGSEIGSFSSPYMIGVGVTDLLAPFGLTSSQASVEHDLIITAWKGLDSTGAVVQGEVTITPDDDGGFYAVIEIDASTQDAITGHINYDTGEILFSTQNAANPNGKVTHLGVVGRISLEKNIINPRVQLNQRKVWLKAIERKISADWTAELEQDKKAYYDIDVQAEFVNIFGNQIALDIDRDIIYDLINWTTRAHSAAIKSFNYQPTPADQFYYGPKQWLENIIPLLNEVSAQIYNDTNIGMANLIVGNPLDVAIFESFDQYRAAGNAVDGASLSKVVPTAGTLAGKWTVLSSPVVPAGKLLVLLKPEEVDRAVYIYGVYRPLVVSPYPMGPTPSITLFSRYAKQLIRYEGLGMINISR